MPRIRLYQTKLDKNNRMGSLQEYGSYLSGVQYRDYTFTKPFTNKSGVLYITDFEELIIDRDYNLFNYALIETITGEELAAFVSLEPLATKGYRVIVDPDYWAQLLKYNRGGNAVDLHGKCIRAHINEWEEYNEETETFSKPTLKNTYLVQEENVSVSDTKRSSIIHDMVSLPENFAYIYVYFNNPNQQNISLTPYGMGAADLGLFSSVQKILEPLGNTMAYKAVQGGVAVGCINLETGLCCFNGLIGGNSVATEHKLFVTEDTVIPLKNLTNSYITSISISPIPPWWSDNRNVAVIESIVYSHGPLQNISTIVAYPVYGESSAFTCTYSGGDFSLPKNMCFPTKIDGYLEYDDFILYSSDVSTIKKGDTLQKTDGNYRNSIVKLKSFIYEPVMYNGNVFDTLHTTNLKIYNTADGTQYIGVFDSDILDGNERIVYSNSSYLFAPDTVLDYWTKLNAERTTKALENQSTMMWFNVAKSAANTASRVANSKTETGAVTAGISGTIDFGANLVNAIQQQAIIDIDTEIAQSQHTNGVVNSKTPSGYYGSHLFANTLVLSHIKMSDKAYSVVEEQLHRYGYATFLLLEDVLENHRREKFNYVQCSQVEVHGADIDLANDVMSMFQNGVHLWHTNDVGNYDTANYQTNV